MKTPFVSLLFLTLIAGMAQAEEPASAPAEADVAAGEELFQGDCRNCHGPKAQGMASYPKLSDKEPDYLTIRLEQYRAGEKIGPNSPLMIPHAQDLTDADISNIVAYVTTAFR